MATIDALVYVSTAVRIPSTAELEHLLTRARARNADHAVTGVLLYSDGNFMQYLEGPGAGIDTVYEFIKIDPLHRGIIELIREPIPRREFAQWSMAFRTLDGQREPPAEQYDHWLTKRLAGTTSYSCDARKLLTGFWNRGRSPGSG